MRKMLFIFAVFCLPLFFFSGVGFSEILFQDDFESYSSTWNCTDGKLPGIMPDGNSRWSVQACCAERNCSVSGSTKCIWSNMNPGGHALCPVEETCTGEEVFGALWRMGPGHNSSNALYAWKNNQVPNVFCSEMNHWFYGSDIKTEIYHRWYMKMPPASKFDKSLHPGSCKLWRYELASNGVTPWGEIYLNLHGSHKLSTTQLTILSGHLTLALKKTSNFNDDTWHCHEIRMKMNSKGRNDGVLQYWFDGVLAQTYNRINWSHDNIVAGPAFNRFGVGMGNCSDEPWDQKEWSAIAFDDVVVSTAYVGQTGGGGSSPPAVSSGVPVR